MDQDEHEKISPDYLKGFNEGYIISEHMPELAGQLEKAVGESERGKGFREGREQLLLEQTKEKLQQKSKGLDISPEPERSRDHDLDR